MTDFLPPVTTCRACGSDQIDGDRLYGVAYLCLACDFEETPGVHTPTPAEIAALCEETRAKRHAELAASVTVPKRSSVAPTRVARARGRPSKTLADNGNY